MMDVKASCGCSVENGTVVHCSNHAYLFSTAKSIDRMADEIITMASTVSICVSEHLTAEVKV